MTSYGPLRKQGAATSSACGACIVGSYCPLGTIAPYACPVGTYRAQTSGAALADCTTCDANSYCPTAGAATPTACPTFTVSAPGSQCPPHPIVACTFMSSCFRRGA